MAFQSGKTFKLLGGLALMALILAACGNETAVGGTPTPIPTTVPTTAAATTAAATLAIATVAPTTAAGVTATVTTTTVAVTGGAVGTVTPGGTQTSGTTGGTTATPTAIGGIGTPGGTTTPGGVPGLLTASNTTATQTAQGELKDAAGKTLGHVFLAQDTGGVKVVLTYNGLPVGDHGLHFHAVGKCEGPDFASAGAHFNPENKKHGLMAPDGPHAGDLPDLIVPASRTGIYETTTNLVTLGNGPDQLIGQFGAALVVHANPDDGKTDPSGNSGARIACAVLIANALTLPGATPGSGTAAPGTVTPGTITSGGSTTSGGTSTPGAATSPVASVTAGTPGATTPGTPGPTTARPITATGTTAPGGTTTPTPTS
jgi:superoxide dismutase, Cu-Zn family